MPLRYLTAGESHGRALVGILEGIPSGLNISAESIHAELQRRKWGYGRGFRQKIEKDEVEILSGIRHGKTLGSPITLLIWNQDWTAWQDIMKVESDSAPVRKPVHVPRPGHADWVGGFKYAHSDMRNVLERASARETAIRVAVGSVARLLLKPLGIVLSSRVVRIGSVEDTSGVEGLLPELNPAADLSPVRCTHLEMSQKMMEQIDAAKEKGDSLGGEFEVYATGIPVGLGSYVHWDRRLEAAIGQAFLSLNAIKGVEIGLGFQLARKLGSEAHDEIYRDENYGGEIDQGEISKAETDRRYSNRISFKTNRSGGIDGGMSTGQPIVVRAGMKPLATLMKPLQSVNLLTGEPALAHVERSDVCAVPAASVIGESLLALVLVNQILEKFGSDSMEELKQRVSEWNNKSLLG